MPWDKPPRFPHEPRRVWALAESVDQYFDTPHVAAVELVAEPRTADGLLVWRHVRRLTMYMNTRHGINLTHVGLMVGNVDGTLQHDPHAKHGQVAADVVDLLPADVETAWRLGGVHLGLAYCPSGVRGRARYELHQSVAVVGRHKWGREWTSVAYIGSLTANQCEKLAERLGFQRHHVGYLPRGTGKKVEGIRKKR